VGAIGARQSVHTARVVHVIRITLQQLSQELQKLSARHSTVHAADEVQDLPQDITAFLRE
jgi:hypothetical protein